jgi:hypothetical protein
MWDTIREEIEQRKIAINTRACLQNCTNVMQETIEYVNEQKAKGDFSTLPTEIKQVLLAWVDEVIEARDAMIANPAIFEAYKWG